MSSKITKRSVHKTLSLAEKKIIQAVADGEKKLNVARRFEIPPSTLTSILKKKDAIMSSSSSDSRLRQKAGEFPQLEQCLVSWFSQCCQQNVPVSGVMMREKAKSYAESLGINNFRASDGWFDRCKRRHHITFKKVCGESASVEESVCPEWKEKLSKMLENYEPKDVFNADESGLFFKCLPDRTYCFKNEKCHGGKNSKERITLLLAANMDGSEKLTPLMIGKSAKPRCFKKIKSLLMHYRANKKAWMTSTLFSEWLNTLNK